MLTYFNWNVCLPTPCYFTSMLLPYSILPTDTHNKGPILCYSKARDYFEEYVQFFLKLSLTDMNLLDSRPSLVAAAIVLAARKAFGLAPTWSYQLQQASVDFIIIVSDSNYLTPLTLKKKMQVSGYREGELDSVVTLLLLYHGGAVESPAGQDEGYSSFSASPTPSPQSYSKLGRSWSQSQY